MGTVVTRHGSTHKEALVEHLRGVQTSGSPLFGANRLPLPNPCAMSLGLRKDPTPHRRRGRVKPAQTTQNAPGGEDGGQGIGGDPERLSDWEDGGVGRVSLGTKQFTR